MNIHESECTQIAWLEYAQGVLAASIGHKLRGTDGQWEEGVKVQLKAYDVQKEIMQRQTLSRSNENLAWGCWRCVHP